MSEGQQQGGAWREKSMTRCNDYKGNCLLIVPGSKSSGVRGGDSVSTPGVLSHPQVVCSPSRPSCSLSPHRRSTQLTHFTPIAVWRRLHNNGVTFETMRAIHRYQSLYIMTCTPAVNLKIILINLALRRLLLPAPCATSSPEDLSDKRRFFHFKRRLRGVSARGFLGGKIKQHDKLMLHGVEGAILDQSKCRFLQ